MNLLESIEHAIGQEYFSKVNYIDFESLLPMEKSKQASTNKIFSVNEELLNIRPSSLHA